MVGGYDSRKFKAALTQPKSDDWKNPTVSQDKFFKSLLYDKYNRTTIDDVEINGYVPDKIYYIDGGFDNIENINVISRRRLKLDSTATYEPDFIIEIGANRYLVIECDEGNEYHQDSTFFRYQTKNLIYSEMLHSVDENQNIVILRICYNSGVNQYDSKYNDERKNDTASNVKKCINIVIEKMIKNEIKNQYVLLKLEADRLRAPAKFGKQETYHTNVKEFIGIKAKEEVKFEEPDYSYFQIDLNTKKYINGESCEDKFIISDYFKYLSK